MHDQQIKNAMMRVAVAPITTWWHRHASPSKWRMRVMSGRQLSDTNDMTLLSRSPVQRLC